MPRVAAKLSRGSLQTGQSSLASPPRQSRRISNEQTVAGLFKLAFHGADTDTDTDTDFLARK